MVWSLSWKTTKVTVTLKTHTGASLSSSLYFLSDDQPPLSLSTFSIALWVLNFGFSYPHLETGGQDTKDRGLLFHCFSKEPAPGVWLL